MLGKTLKVLLLISLVFNIAFVSEYLYHRFIKKPPVPPRLEKYPKLKEAIQHHRELIKPKREEFFHIRREFIKYLMQKDFNEEEAKRILDDTLKKQIQLEKMMGKHLIELRKNLDYEKARNFFRRHCFEKHKLPIRRKK